MNLVPVTPYNTPSSPVSSPNTFENPKGPMDLDMPKLAKSTSTRSLLPEDKYSLPPWKAKSPAEVKPMLPKLLVAPKVGLEPTTLRLRAARVHREFPLASAH